MEFWVHNAEEVMAVLGTGLDALSSEPDASPHAYCVMA